MDNNNLLYKKTIDYIDMIIKSHNIEIINSFESWVCRNIEDSVNEIKVEKLKTICRACARYYFDKKMNKILMKKRTSEYIENEYIIDVSKVLKDIALDLLKIIK